MPLKAKDKTKLLRSFKRHADNLICYLNDNYTKDLNNIYIALSNFDYELDQALDKIPVKKKIIETQIDDLKKELESKTNKSIDTGLKI